MKTKKCSKCQKEKSTTEFYISKKKKDGLQPYCKLCLIKNSKKDYKENDRKKIFGNRANCRRKKMKSFTDRIKKQLGCCICEENTPCCLEFHHIDEKEKEIGISYIVSAKSRKKLIKELPKCTVVCANCHKKIHAGLLKVNKEKLYILTEDIKKEILLL